MKVLKSEKVTLTPNKDTKQDRNEEDAQIPKYLSQLDLSDDIKGRILEEILAEKSEIKKERDNEGLEGLWDSLDDQYDGIIDEVEDRQFNLHKHTTKVKIDAISGSIVEAYLDTDPKYSFTPRPEFAKEGEGLKVAEKQTDFVDYKIDTVIPLEKEMQKVAHSAALKGTGWLKWSHKIERVNRKREEVYEGTEGLKDFKDNYSHKKEVTPGYEGFVKRLSEGKKISIISEFKETIYNDPFPQYVDLKDLFVRLNTDGYDGLKTTLLMAERKEYLYWELKKLEKEPNGFYNIDKLLQDKDGKKIESRKKKTFEILECTYYYKEDPNDDKEEYKRGIFWISEKEKLMVGSINYPYYGFDSQYVPHYVKMKETGIYQPGVGEDLTDANIAEDALLNFILEGLWASNIITPIVPEGSAASEQFLDKRWAHGVPINAKKGEVSFLDKPRQDVGGMIAMLQQLAKNNDDVSSVSSLITGRESEVDPTAPARKTLALLEQSGKGIKRYIKTMLPSFVQSANIVLNLYNQMSSEARRYKIRPERVVGDNPFDEITRSEMIAQTNIEARAMAFDFDKLNEKREDVALMSILDKEHLYRSNPESVHAFVKNLIKGWSPRWKNRVDEIWPSLDEVKQKEMAAMLQAIQVFIDQASAEAEATGQELKFDPMKLLQIAGQLKQQIANPAEEEKGGK